MATIDKISIEGFKSIRRLADFELRNINVLIGPNGSEKSNFVSFFKLLRDLIEQQVQVHIGREGGADAALFLGRRETKEIQARLYFGKNGFAGRGSCGRANKLFFTQSKVLVNEMWFWPASFRRGSRLVEAVQNELSTARAAHYVRG